MVALYDAIYHSRRMLLSRAMTHSMDAYADIMELATPLRGVLSGLNKTSVRSDKRELICPEDFSPLANHSFQNPYGFYRMLRDRYPIYRLKSGVYCISRYEDIVSISRQPALFSSQHQGVVANLKPHQDLMKEIQRFEYLSNLGVVPADVLATSDPPEHTFERKVGHSTLGARYVKSLENEVETLCTQMLAEYLRKGSMEFMAAFGWKLPMLLIIRLIGLPERDFDQIKNWCVEILNSQNGIQDSKELARSYSNAFQFLNYCWRHYLAAKKSPPDNLLGMIVKAAKENPNFSDAKAVSSIFQLLIAGSDSSATTMGNALKMLIENPHIQAQLRSDPDSLPDYIEEVFRLESAFQGHFRWVKQDTIFNGIPLKKGSRVFLLWASGNRDERCWERPDDIILGRKNGKKHLTFGHGIHACIGRELARMEIRIVLQAFLKQTHNLKVVGETPYIASMFARTLVKLPIEFSAV
ncbi:MAG: cytochrome P450 [Pseudomonadales bacterium]|nr:cytochrome P450 [Pseudomonadales bacterium]